MGYNFFEQLWRHEKKALLGLTDSTMKKSFLLDARRYCGDNCFPKKVYWKKVARKKYKSVRVSSDDKHFYTFIKLWDCTFGGYSCVSPGYPASSLINFELIQGKLLWFHIGRMIKQFFLDNFWLADLLFFGYSRDDHLHLLPQTFFGSKWITHFGWKIWPETTGKFCPSAACW